MCAPGCGCGCSNVGMGYIAGAGPDVAQTQHARARAMFPGDTESGRRNTPGANIARADFPALQQFPHRPAIHQTIVDADAGVGAGTTTSLPGRFPPAGWDGENDRHSPHSNAGVT